jgi:acetyltransferase
MAFVAFGGAGSDVVGVVRIHSDSAYERGEYAILVRSDFHGVGLGMALVNLLIAYARREGLKEIFGYVLRENAAMLAICRKLGFKIDAGASAPEVLDVSLRLI